MKLYERTYYIIRSIAWVCIITAMLLTIYVENERHERVEMINTPIFSYEEGYYSSAGYYCIWTDGRTFNDVSKTVLHEECHWLIDKDYEHFCEE